ncbi:MAG TPA: tyrosine-protein phosphatase [Pyrinomonadaceae bacterium]|nr:tyrosine-protein phosphatase [Pyrinomonadaceae bacterium]
MRTVKRNSPPVLFALISLISLSSAALAQETQKNHASVSIKNFGQMDDRFFRGGQPKVKEYQELAALGVKTVIDLRNDPKDYGKEVAESLGMRYVNIPMSDKDYPPAEKIAEFLKLIDNPETGKFYVHCAGGRHRTGVIGAVYRFNHYGWDFEKVYAEMKKYDFYTRWGHGKMKEFVKDYAVNFQPRP